MGVDDVDADEPYLSDMSEVSGGSVELTATEAVAVEYMFEQHRKQRKLAERRGGKAGPAGEAPEAEVEVEEPEFFVRRKVSELLAWDDPLLSGLCVALLAVVFGLLRFSGYSGLTLVAFLELFQLSVTTLGTQFAPLLQEVGVLGRDFDPERFAEQRQLVSGADIARFASGAGVIAADAIDRFDFVVREEEDEIKLGALLAGLSGVVAVGLFADTYVVLCVAALAAFALQPLYKLNEEGIEDLIQQLREKFGHEETPNMHLSDGEGEDEDREQEDDEDDSGDENDLDAEAQALEAEEYSD